MHPTPAKRQRRSSSPISPTDTAYTARPPSARPPSSRPSLPGGSGPLSPTTPYLPPPLPLSSGHHHPPTLPPPSSLTPLTTTLPALSSALSPRGPLPPIGAGPSNWEKERERERERERKFEIDRERERDRELDREREREREQQRERWSARRSMDVRELQYRGGPDPRERDLRDPRDPTSPSSPGSPQTQMDIEESTSTETGLVFTRDTSNRAPRSMMACTRCRRQKMKCDGPSVHPCRGCRQSGSQCIFEPRTRPKSISVLPTRAAPFYPASNMGPGSGIGPPGSSGRPQTPSGMGSVGFYPASGLPAPPALSRQQMNEPYALRSAREPMPPPMGSSISALTSAYASSAAPPTSSGPVGLGIVPGGPGPGRATPPPLMQVQHPSIYHPHPPPLAPGYAPPAQSSSHGRPHSPPRAATSESRLRSLEGSMRGLRDVPVVLSGIQQSLGSLQSSVEVLHASSGPSSATEVPEQIWEDYRTRAWPLTPWLVGMRDPTGISGLVVDYLGKRALVEKAENGRAAVDEAAKRVRRELIKLGMKDPPWQKEDVRAIGVFATWVDDPTLVALSVTHGRTLGLDRIWNGRKTNDDWREWIYLSIMEYLVNLVDLNAPLTREPLAAAWREKLTALDATQQEPAVRDRDHKLLAWLEYAEMLAEVQSALSAIRRDMAREESAGNVDLRAAEALVDVWRRLGSRWEAWASAWSARADLILNLHFNFAILFTTSPLFFAREGIWEALLREAEGRALLERARDAAFAVAAAICAPEIGRTIVYSYTLYRPILAHALILLINLTSLPPMSPPLISTTHVSDVLRSTWDMIATARPVGWTPGGILGEIVERGDGRVVGEAGRELWRRFLG